VGVVSDMLHTQKACTGIEMYYMGRVQFNDPQYTKKDNDASASGIGGFLVKSGIVHTRRQALYLLLSLAVLGIVTSAFLLMSTAEEPVNERYIFDPATKAPDVDEIKADR